MFLHKNLLLFIAFLLGVSLHAQYKIKGKILDENKLPIAQAMVKSISTGESTLTDDKGNYTLSTSDEHPSLQVNKEGYAPLEFPVILQNNENRVTYVETILRRGAEETLSDIVELQPVVISDNPSLVANSVGLAKVKLDKVAGGTNLADLNLELLYKISLGVMTNHASISVVLVSKVILNHVGWHSPKMVFLSTSPTVLIL